MCGALQRMLQKVTQKGVEDSQQLQRPKLIIVNLAMTSDKSKRARMASRSRMRLALSLACATVLAAHCIVGDASADDAATFVIDANTQLKDVFQVRQYFPPRAEICGRH